MASHIPHPHSSQHKGRGYAFSLNLVRSLGLWSLGATFPSDVQKPTYLCLNPANNAIDWSEQLRKYTKHNSDHEARLIAACTRLELIVWRSIEARTTRPRYLELQKRRLDRRRRLVKRATDNAEPGNDSVTGGQLPNTSQVPGQEHLPPPPDELLVKKQTSRDDIKKAMQEVAGLLNIDEKGPAAKEARILLALAAYSLGHYAQCLDSLPPDNGGFAGKKDASSHDLDLQVLAIVLRGMAHEQLSRASQSNDLNLQSAIAAYRSLPIAPPPPIPEAQRYVEMGLARLALLESPTNLQVCQQHLQVTSTFKSVSPAKRLLMYRTYLTAVLDQLQSRALDATVSEHSGETDDIDTTSVFATIQSYEQLLLSNPSLARFPKAGEPTVNMYEYIDTLFAFWDMGIVPGKYTVESLYRALAKTFACQRLHRYIVIVSSTLSFIENDREKGREHSLDALRNLRLYIALFEKSMETDSKSVQRELNQYRRDHGELSSSEDDDGEESGGVPSSSDKSASYDPVESDDDFCRVACVGTRILLTESRLDGKQEQEDDRLELVEEALTTIEKAKRVLEKETSRDTENNTISGQDTSAKPAAKPSHGKSLCREKSAVNAEVHMWLGIARAEWALAEAEPEQSRETATTALVELQAAIGALPQLPPHASTAIPTSPMSEMSTPAKYAADSLRALHAKALYSLAYAQLEARDVRSAVATAKLAIDAVSNPEGTDQSSSHASTLCDNMKIWHLFVLALTARKDLARATEVASLALYGDVDDAATINDAHDNEEVPVRPSFLAHASRALTAEDAPAPASPSHQFTRGDAPYDPSATGTAHNGLHRAEYSPPIVNGEDATSSFVNVRMPNGSNSSPPNGTSGSTGRTSSPSIAASLQGSTAGRFMEKRQEPMTLRTTSPWDDLEAEIDLMLTRNKCIEAVQGPEVALQDLQANVFTRFSKKRDDLEQIVDPRPAGDVVQPIRTRASTAATATYPYPSSSMQDGARLAQQLDEFSARQNEQPQGRARSILGSISLRHHRSRTNTASQPEGHTQSAHLTVPVSGAYRAESIRSNGSVTANEPTRHPHDGNTGSGVPVMPQVNAPAASVQSSPALQPQAARILSRLWLASAATFRRWGKMDEYLGAINEAEDVAGDKDPEVWLQYALYLKFATEDGDDLQHLAMSKALAIYTDHVPTCLLISKTHLDRGNWAIAEGFLDTATQTNAWDSPEAWYLLAKVYENTRRRQRAKDCLIYALELEKTRPIRELRATLPRFI